jgi:hypothetical protein
MIEPRSADEGAFATLSRAKALIEGRDFDSAALLYFQLLDGDLPAPLRGEVMTNLAAALCMSARNQQDPAALARLDQARDLLVTALTHRPRKTAPEAWATTRANLSLVHLARHEITGSNDDLLSAHLMLDGVEQTLRDAGATTLLDWMIAIRDQLLELRERRHRRR